MSNLTIAIDAFPLAERIAGIGRYVLEICHELDALMPEARFFLYSPSPLTVKTPSERWLLKVGGKRLARTASSYIWLKTLAGRMAEMDGAHIFWATRTILPAKSTALKTVSTVHDLNYRLFPQSMPHVTLWVHRVWFHRDVRRANVVVTNSQGTADRLRKLLGVEADAVARPGVAKVFGPKIQEDVKMRLAALRVNKPYFLTVGTLEPRKNLQTLIDAFVTLKCSGKLAEYELLIVGRPGWRSRRLHESLVEAQKLGVRWLGFVEDVDLAALYAGATAFVFPSLYEGFGIPVVEARACGTQIVASDLPELREAGGPCGIYVSPTMAGIQSGLLAAIQAPLPTRWEPTNWRSAGEIMAGIFQHLSNQ